MSKKRDSAVVAAASGAVASPRSGREGVVKSVCVGTVAAVEDAAERSARSELDGEDADSGC